MKGTCARLLLVSLISLFGTSVASAIPLLSIDLDPATPGIQTTRTVLIGAPVNVDVVYTGDGAAQFDTTVFGIFFNDMGPVLGLGAGAPIAGGLADTAPSMAIDVFGSVPVESGDPLTTVPGPIPPGFGASTGVMGLSSATLPFPIIGAGIDIDVLGVNLVANALGISTLSLMGVFGPELALAGEAVPVELNTGILRVVQAPVPEPRTLFLMTLGLLLIVGSFKRQRRHRI